MSDIILENITKKIESFGSDNLEVCGGTCVGGIHSQQIPDEIAPLIFDIIGWVFLEMPPKRMLEIGTASGASSFIFNHFFNLDHITIIDDNKHKNHIYRKDILNGINYVEFIGDSHSNDALDFVKGLDMAYDIILIDGDHSYNGVKRDMEMYYQFSDYMSWIILHDIIACPGVKQFLNELMGTAFYQYDIAYKKSYESKKHNPPLGLGLFRSFNGSRILKRR